MTLPSTPGNEAAEPGRLRTPGLDGWSFDPAYGWTYNGPDAAVAPFDPRLRPGAVPSGALPAGATSGVTATEPEAVAGPAGPVAAGVPGTPNQSSAIALAVPQAAGDYQALTGGTLDGAGLTIGILSDSFDLTGAEAAAIMDGYLPSAAGQVNIIQEGASGQDEGLAMAELIYQIAPGATIDFYTATGSEQQFATGIDTLVADGANVIVDDVAYTDEPFYQNTGVITEAVESAVAAGVDYFTAAGNGSNNFYEAVFTPITTTTPGPGPGPGHTSDLTNLPGIGPVIANEVATSGSPYESVYLNADAKLDFTVEWTQAFGANSYDLGVGLFSLSNGIYTLVDNFANTGSNDHAVVTSDPVLSVDTTTSVAAGTYYLAFYDAAGTVPADSTFKLIFFGDSNAVLLGPDSGVGSGTSLGHELATGANSVAAVNVDEAPPTPGVTTPVVEGFSGAGPGETYTGTSGSQLTDPVSDGSPDFAATDGTPTSTALDPFYGTSAASANAAGVGLLVVQADRRLSTGQVTTLLERSAIPTASTLTGGAGLIQADVAVEAAVTADTTPIWTMQAGSTAWSTAGNWSDDAVPGGSDPVQITDGIGLLTGAYAVDYDVADSTVASLLVDGGTYVAARPTLTVDIGDTLDAGTVTLGAGTIDVDGTLDDAGALARGSAPGTLALGGLGDLEVGGAATGSDIAFAGTGGTLDFTTASSATLVSSLTDAISGFGLLDTLDLSGLAVSSVGGVHVAGSDVTVVDSGGDTLAALDVTGSFTSLGFIADPEGGTELVACFLRGTRIATPGGEIAVESLRAGDRVMTASGRAAPVRWLGHRRLCCATHARPHLAFPVRIAAGAFGPGLPGRDLWLSPQHAVFAGGALVPAHALLNGATVMLEPLDAAEYWHVELDRHDVILAEGLPCESWLDTGNRAMFDNVPHALSRPEFDEARTAATARAAHACAPLVEDGPLLDALRMRLAARAEALGSPVDGAIAIELTGAGTVEADVPPGVTEVTLRSTSARPPGDARRLGAALRRLALDGADLALGGACFRRGFHGVEGEGVRGWRWTDGAGVLVLARSPRARTLAIEVQAVLGDEAARAA